MTKITAEHLARRACVYIRQSIADQLAHNHESRRCQYGLVDRAKQLGCVDVIDDDLGRSGGDIARPGFERLLATICDSRVGAVLAIEASRLARNGRDWHTLIEVCGLVGTLIVDEDGIYDPRHPNDRLLLAPTPLARQEAQSRDCSWTSPQRRKRPKSAAAIKRAYRAKLKRKVEAAKYAVSRERRARSRAARRSSRNSAPGTAARYFATSPRRASRSC